MSLLKPTHVEARPNHRLYLRYADGAEGEVDVADLSGRGVFECWNDPAIFESVRLGADGSLQWGDDIELCADAMYMRLTGRSAEQAFNARQVTLDA